MSRLPLCCLMFVMSSLLSVREAPAKGGDPVEALRTLLKEPITPDRTDRSIKDRKKRLEAAAEHLTSAADLCRALSLMEWGSAQQGPGADRSLLLDLGNRAAVRKSLADQAVKTIRTALSKESPTRRQALLVIVRQSVRAERELIGQGRGGPRGFDRDAAFAPAFPPLAADLLKLHDKAKEVGVRRAALQALMALSLSRDTILALKRALGSKDQGERRHAASGLSQALAADSGTDRRRQQLAPYELVPLIEALTPLATTTLEDSDAVVRREGSIALAKAVKQGAVLVEMPLHLARAEGLGKEESAKLLREEVERIRPALSVLDRALAGVAKRLADEDHACALAAHDALKEAATLRLCLAALRRSLPAAADKKSALPNIDAPVKAVPGLIKSLGHKEVRLRLGALYVLETLMGDAVGAAEALAKVLADEDRYVRWGAARALRNMAPAGAAKAGTALAKALSDESADVRNTAAFALARYGREAKGQVEAMTNAMAKADDDLRPLICRALGAVGPDAKNARPTLVKVLQDDKSPNARRAAAEAIGRMGPADARTKEALVAALDDPEESVQVAAAASLLAIE